MPRYKKKEKPRHARHLSVFTSVFPLLTVLYAEMVFCLFSDMSLTVYKVLFALSLGGIAAALGHVTPSRAVNCVLQTAYTVFCVGFIAVQYLCYQTIGYYFTPFSNVYPLPGRVFLNSTAQSELLFVLCMALPVLLQLTAQNILLFRRKSAVSALLGGNAMELFGALLLSVLLAFASVSLAVQDDTGAPSPKRQIADEYVPEVSVRTFGVLPQTLLDLKFNVLHIRETDTVHNFIVAENGEHIELSEEELDKWNREG